MPNRWLSSKTIFSGNCLRFTVPSSCTFIMKEPSPEIQITVSFGRATCAPTAAGKPKPIVPEAARGDKIFRAGVGHMLCRPHLMLANIRCHYAVRGFAIGQLLQQQWRVDSLTGMIIARYALCAVQHYADAMRQSSAIAAMPAAENLNHPAMLRALAQLVHFRRVDIHVDHAGVWCEGIQLAGYPVIKTRAHCNQ